MKRKIEKATTSSRHTYQRLKDERVFHYLAAGGLAFGAEYITFLVLFYSVGSSAVISNSVSFAIGLAVSFTVNKLWTFGDKVQARQRGWQLASYIGLALCNLLITNALLVVLVAGGVPAFVAKLGLVVAVASWNYFLLKRLIFK